MSGERSDAIVFFGATGDLAFKQIFPALAGLVRDEGVAVPIVGVARPPWTHEKLCARARDSLKAHGSFDEATFEKLGRLLKYVGGDYGDPNTFQELKRALGTAQRPLHYLAIPPSLFAAVVGSLAKAGLNVNARLVVEKPFGRDRASAAALNRTLRQYFPEETIFRIDHYLGKEPVQNIVYTRFANGAFEPIWNRIYVKSIQITMAEAFGVEDRGGFYDATGALRDVVQNHMLQVVANLMMDPPTGEEHEAWQDQKAELLKAILPLDPANVVRGQYDGYRSVPGVKPDSSVETFVALKLYVDSWRWAGTPVYIRAGKKLPATAAEVLVEFNPTPRAAFGENRPSSGYMRFRIGPDVAVAMGLRVKRPGETMAGEDVEMLLCERTASLLPPYQRLLGDALRGDRELFGREDIIDAQWRVVQPALDSPPECRTYAPGTWGPKEAAALMGPDDAWRDPKPSSTA